MNWKVYLWATAATTIAALTIGDYVMHNAGISTQAAAHSDAATSGMTKKEFDHFAYQKTKAQIRAAFGKPDSADGNADSWYYANLAVYDPDAGIRVPVIVQFEGLDDASDAVASVRFP